MRRRTDARDCTCPRTHHQHGTVSAYKTDGCRCDACYRAQSRSEKWRRAFGGRDVPAVGTQRRLQALMANGWPVGDLADRLGMARQVMSALLVHRRIVRHGTAVQVAELYDQLWSATPALGDLHRQRSTSRSRLRAQRNGWPPPLAWDDGAGPHGIDNPHATPHDVTPTEWRGGTRIEDVLWLAEAGTPVAAICERLGCTDKDVRDALRRAGRPRLWQAIRVDPLGMCGVRPSQPEGLTNGNGTIRAQEKRPPGAVLARSGFNGGSDRHDCKES